MATIKEVIKLALTDYSKHDFMCHCVEALHDTDVMSQEDVKKTLDFIESKIVGHGTLTGFLYAKEPEYAQLCGVEQDRHHFESAAPHAYRVKWWNEVIQLPEAQV